MSFSFRLVYTSDQGVILKPSWKPDRIITEIVNTFSFNERAGDEYYVKSGDLSIKTYIPLKSPPGHQWLLVYFNNTLFNAYKVERNYDELDHKRNVYSYRLRPLQAIFFDDLKNSKVQYEGFFINNWNYDLTAASVTIKEIKINENQTILDRWGFSLGNMIENLTGRNNDTGYSINNVSSNLPTLTADDLPILYRGLSKDVTLASEQEALEFTFSDDEVTWKDIFEFALFATNSLLKAKPVIGGAGATETLKVDIDLISRIGAAPTPKAVKWYERSRIENRYKIKGVKLTGLNFTYTQGDSEHESAFKKEIAIADPGATIAQFDETLYWSEGDYDSGSGKYDILDAPLPDGNPKPYFASGLVEPHYDGMINDAHGYSGEIDFEGVFLLDQLKINSNETIQILEQTIDQKGFAKIEGIVI